jgi:hypothetical protein
MAESREIKCGSKTYIVKFYDDDVIGIFDADGRMILGWPETTVFASPDAMQRPDEEWCKRLGRLRKLG